MTSLVTPDDRVIIGIIGRDALTALRQNYPGEFIGICAGSKVVISYELADWLLDVTGKPDGAPVATVRL